MAVPREIWGLFYFLWEQIAGLGVFDIVKGADLGTQLALFFIKSDIRRG